MEAWPCLSNRPGVGQRQLPRVGEGKPVVDGCLDVSSTKQKPTPVRNRNGAPWLVPHPSRASLLDDKRYRVGTVESPSCGLVRAEALHNAGTPYERAGPSPSAPHSDLFEKAVSNPHNRVSCLSSTGTVAHCGRENGMRRLRLTGEMLKSRRSNSMAPKIEKRPGSHFLDNR